jgi:hypothetical protein
MDYIAKLTYLMLLRISYFQVSFSIIEKDKKKNQNKKHR